MWKNAKEVLPTESGEYATVYKNIKTSVERQRVSYFGDIDNVWFYELPGNLYELTHWTELLPFPKD